jgi:RNA polymerase sigma factor (sigma-70 family)
MGFATIKDVGLQVSSAASVYNEHGEFIRTIIFHHVKNKSLAEDIYQDFFISLISKPIPGDVINIRNYLYKAIKNDIYDAVRRYNNYRCRLEKYDSVARVNSNLQNHEDLLASVEERDKIFSLVEKHLPKCISKAIMLRYKNNFNVAEIAKDLQVDVRTVSRYLSIGLKQLRQKLAVEQGL